MSTTPLAILVSGHPLDLAPHRTVQATPETAEPLLRGEEVDVVVGDQALLELAAHIRPKAIRVLIGAATAPASRVHHLAVAGVEELAGPIRILTRRPVPNTEVVLREEFDDWALLFDPDSAVVVGVNPVGVAVWKLLDGRRSLREVVLGVAETFDEVPCEVVDHIVGLLEDLRRRGLVGYELGEAP